jgi:exodeoxyribonuclease VII small subunit
MSKSKITSVESNKSDTKLSFEDSLKRLERIVEVLEGENSSLEESIKLYEEGMLLGKSCMTQLNEAKLKLKKIQKVSGGALEEAHLET